MKGSVIFAAVVGAAVGALAVYIYYNKKMESIIDERMNEEVKDIKAIYRHRKEDSKPEEKKETPKEEVHQEEPKVEHVSYNKAVNLEKIETPEPAKPSIKEPSPEVSYIITPDEFCNRERFDDQTWYYWRDGIMTDTDNVPISDKEVKETLPADFSNHFGDYLDDDHRYDDTVYIRNEKEMTDYEVILQDTAYCVTFPRAK